MKILFFGIQYHTYTRAIIEEMEGFGATVKFVDLQPRNLGNRISRTLARSSYEKYVEQSLKEAVNTARSTQYDKVVFLQAHQMPTEILANLRQSQANALFSLYNWDAITTHNYRPQAAYFDRVLTFDRNDAEANGYEYLPLFCIRRWQDLAFDSSIPRSVYVVGNIVRMERYRAIEQFRTFCAENDLTFREHLKISPVVMSHALRQGIWPKGVSLRSISEDNFAQMIEASLAAFDFANHAQSGQTMRMMESLCSGKKVITNNHWVRHEPFYSSDRIHIIEGKNYLGIPEFLDTPLADPMKTFPEYHIQNFTCKFIGLENSVKSKLK